MNPEAIENGMLSASFETKNFIPKKAVSNGILLKLRRVQPVMRDIMVPNPAPESNMDDAIGKNAYGPIANNIPPRVPKNIPLNPASLDSQLLTNSSGIRTSIKPANTKATIIRGAVYNICFIPDLIPSYCFPFFFELISTSITAAILSMIVV